MSSNQIRRSTPSWLLSLLVLAAAFGLAACGDEVTPSSGKTITTFSFSSTSNPNLVADVVARIQGTTIAATVPFGTEVSALKATFSTTGVVTVAACRRSAA